MGSPFVVHEYVRWGDVDIIGIIRYDAYLRFFVNALHDTLEEILCSLGRDHGLDIETQLLADFTGLLTIGVFVLDNEYPGHSCPWIFKKALLYKNCEMSKAGDTAMD